MLILNKIQHIHLRFTHNDIEFNSSLTLTHTPTTTGG